MTTIDSTALAFVTGGTAQTAAPTATPQAPEGASTQQGGNFLSGIQQFLSFLQTPQFGQLIGGIQSLFSSFAGGAQPAQPTQQAPTPAAG